MSVLVIIFMGIYCYVRCLGCISTVSPDDVTLAPCVCPNLNPQIFAPLIGNGCPQPAVQTRPTFNQVANPPGGGQCAIMMTCPNFVSFDSVTCETDINMNTLIVCFANTNQWMLFRNGVAVRTVIQLACVIG